MQLSHYSVIISIISSWHRCLSDGHITNAHTSHLQAQEESCFVQNKTLICMAVVA